MIKPKLCFMVWTINFLICSIYANRIVCMYVCMETLNIAFNLSLLCYSAYSGKVVGNKSEMHLNFVVSFVVQSSTLNVTRILNNVKSDKSNNAWQVPCSIFQDLFMIGVNDSNSWQGLGV